MSKCQDCKHDCHCEDISHIDVCECTKCICDTQDEDRTWENEVQYDK